MRVLIFAVGITACNPESGLEGSVALSLDFDTVVISKQEVFLVIEYQRRSAEAVEKVCKIVVDTDGLDIPDSGEVELEGEAFAARVELQRSTVANDAFPPTRSGKLTFSELEFRVGGQVAGEFAITFEDEGSLSGWFGGEIGSSTAE